MPPASKADNRRINAICLILLLGAAFAITATSQARLQLFNAKDVLDEAAAHNKYLQRKTDYARRGSILASDGQALAQDVDSYQLSLQVGPGKIPQSRSFYMALSEASGIPATEFEQFVQSVPQDQLRVKTWPESVGTVQADAITTVKRRWHADGVSLTRTALRSYPLAATAASVVGVVRNGVASRGLEEGLDKDLRGMNGSAYGLVDRQGAFLPLRLESETKKIDGKPVVLTIDTKLQDAAAISLKEAVISNAADSGTAIVMDPKTGDILAMATYPTFDPVEKPNQAQAVERKLGVNAAVEERLEPGSTFKILTLAKAMDMDKVHENDIVVCKGELPIGKHAKIRCDDHHGNRAHGPVNPEMAIEKSCNVSAATWAHKITHPVFVDFMHSLGLLDEPGTGLPREIRGRYHVNEPAKELQLATFGFGQSVTTTPLALASAFTSLANGGVRMRPRLIEKFGDQERPVQEGNRVLKPETAAKVVGYMESVMSKESGTGYALRIPGYRLAGKTGTAQKVGFKTGGHVSNFVGFVPAVDTRAVILVMIDNPKKGLYYGAQVAGPVFKNVAQSVIRRYNIQPTEPVVAATPKPLAPKPAVHAEARPRR